jgi:PAS domain S-box-containing protein
MNFLNFSALDYFADPIIILNAGGRVEFFNKQAIRLSNMFHSAVETGTSFADLISTGRHETVHDILQQITFDRKSRVHELEHHDLKGKVYNLEITYNPIVGETGELEHIYLTIRETSTERIFQKRATQLVQDLSALIERANAVIFGIDSREYITEWNAECSRITGLGKDDVLAKKTDVILEGLFLERFHSLLQDVLLQRSTGNIELQLRTKTGSPVVVLLNATPRTNASGGLIGILFVGHDITELYQYRQSLEQMVKDKTAKLKMSLEKERELVDIKNRFVSLASHEFRIPLSNIISSVNFIKANSHLGQDALEKTTTIEHQVGHMRTLIEDLLTLGTADAHKLKASHQKIDLMVFLKGIITEVVVNAHHSHQVKVEAPDAGIEIESDEKLLRNIFINLLSNAIKFSPGKPAIFLSVNGTGSFVEITVTDEGIGISEPDLLKIFEPFSRGSNATAIKGTGLGLSIAKKAVETLGGSLEIQSTLQKGTTITVKLNSQILQAHE